MAGLFGGMKSAFSGWNKADASGLTGMQRLGNFGSAVQGQAPMYAPQPQQPNGQEAPQAASPDFGQRLGQFGAQMQGMGSPSAPPPQQMGQFGGAHGLPGMGQQPNIRDILQRIYGGR